MMAKPSDNGTEYLEAATLGITTYISFGFCRPPAFWAYLRDRVEKLGQSKIEIASPADLVEAFGELGARCGPRTGPNARTQEDEEWWCMRRYIFTLAAYGQLEFPISITKAERPDFRCDFASWALGIEVAEATHPRDQREVTTFERTRAIATLGTFGGRFAGGTQGDEPERVWQADVVRAIRKIASWPKPLSEYAFLLYSNSNAERLIYDWSDAFTAFRPMNNRLWARLTPSIKSIAVICRDWLLILKPGSFVVYPLRCGVEA